MPSGPSPTNQCDESGTNTQISGPTLRMSSGSGYGQGSWWHKSMKPWCGTPLSRRRDTTANILVVNARSCVTTLMGMLDLIRTATKRCLQEQKVFFYNGLRTIINTSWRIKMVLDQQKSMMPGPVQPDLPYREYPERVNICADGQPFRRAMHGLWRSARNFQRVFRSLARPSVQRLPYPPTARHFYEATAWRRADQLASHSPRMPLPCSTPDRIITAMHLGHLREPPV